MFFKEILRKSRDFRRINFLPFFCFFLLKMVNYH